MVQANPQDSVSAIYVLGVVIAALQTIVTSLMIWLVKTTQDSKDKLNRMDVVLFGERGGPGAIAQFEALKHDQEDVRRTLQRVVFRLGNIEDELRIPRKAADELSQEND